MELFSQPKTFLLIMLISYIFGLGRAIDCSGKNIAGNITVGRGGSFRTIQSAIDSIKGRNNQWIKIHINAGLYIEQVTIPLEKPCIILEGEGSLITVISNSDDQATDTSATFTSYPPNVIVTGIAFKNSFDIAQSYKLEDRSKRVINTRPYTPIEPAVAARVYGDKSYFYKCSFLGYQDTLFDVMGRHYFKECYIQGEIDFIFGNGQSYYEDCTLNATEKFSRNAPGFVTAQKRSSPNDPSGFVFKGGSLVGTGEVNLGRAWGPYSRVIFYGTYLSSLVTPQGWNAWRFTGQEDKFTYAEVDCTGPGADTSKRVPWEKKLSSSQLSYFSFESFINSDKWLDNSPASAFVI